MLRLRLLLAGALAALAACGDAERRPEGLPLALHQPPPSSLLRLPVQGGAVRTYRTSDLSELPWRSEKAPKLRQGIGADLDGQTIYVTDTARTLLAIDLRNRRVRSLQRGITAAGLGADGVLYVVDTAGAVTQLGRRRPVVFQGKVSGPPGTVAGAMSGRLLVLPSSARKNLVVMSAGSPASTIPLAAAPAATTAFGDLVAVATEDGVLLADPLGSGEATQLKVSGSPQAVAFSPSGHRLYVARDEDALFVYDRYSLDRIGSIELPGPARELRSDLYGAWLLVRPAQGDSIWVVDVVARKHVATAASRWNSDLPAVAPPGTLLLRRGKDVVGLDLSDAKLPEVGRVKDGAADFWVAVAWSPEKDESPIVGARDTLIGADSTAVASDSGGTRIYLQVSSSRNPAWANELAQRVSAAGLPASVLPPNTGEDAYRVVLGPYATREAAEVASRSLNMPSFILTESGSTP